MDKKSWITIPLTIIVQIFLILALDISSTKGVILFGFYSAIPSLVVNFYMVREGLNELIKEKNLV